MSTEVTGNGMIHTGHYIKMLEESNETLRSENRRLVSVLIARLNKAEKDADRCKECQVKKIGHENKG